MKLILVVLVLAYAYGLIRFLRSHWSASSKDHLRWVPKEYYDFFKDSKIRDDIFLVEVSDENASNPDEPPQSPAKLLMVANLKSQKILLNWIDILSNIMTMGIARTNFRRLVTVNEPFTLRLYFRNNSETDATILKQKVRYQIRYPNDKTYALPAASPNEFTLVKESSRKFDLGLPFLRKDEHCYAESRKFFAPEVPGDHELVIIGCQNVTYLGPFGLADRRYREGRPNSEWKYAFHVSSEYEYNTLIIIGFTFLVALIAFLMSRC